MARPGDIPTRGFVGTLLLLGLVGSGAVLQACGHCDGALRRAFAWRGLDEVAPHDSDGREVIRPDAHFRLMGDGPLGDDEKLRRLSGMDEEAWFLLDEARGQPVPAEITADSGGHMCLNGVGFNLRPRQPLAPGDYTLVLRPERLRWPLVENDQLGEYEGARTLVVHYRVK